MAQMMMRLALHRLGRVLQTLASHVEQPTVKRTAQAAVLQTAEAQICAAMRASLIHDARGVRPRPETAPTPRRAVAPEGSGAQDGAALTAQPAANTRAAAPLQEIPASCVSSVRFRLRQSWLSAAHAEAAETVHSA